MKDTVKFNQKLFDLISSSTHLSKDNLFFLDKDVEAFLDDDTKKAVLDSISELNKMISADELKVERAGANILFSPTEITQPSNEMLKGGRSYFKFCGVGLFDKIPGFEFGLDSDVLTAIAGGTSIAAAIATTIPEPTASKIIAAVLGVVAGGIGLIASQANGRGWNVRGTLIPIVPIKFWYS